MYRLFQEDDDQETEEYKGRMMNMSDTIRNNYHNRPVRDGTDKVELKNKKNQKRNIKKSRKLEAKDEWSTPNRNKFSRLERSKKGDE